MRGREALLDDSRRSARSSTRRSCAARSATRSSSSRRATWCGIPVMFVVLLGSVLTTARARARHRRASRRHRLHAADHALALVHGALRELRRGDGGGARQGAGGYAAQVAHADAREAARAIGRPTDRSQRARRGARRCATATSCSARRATSFPGDGEVVEGVASVDESRDHGRVRAGHSRSRRRSLGGHRRHEGALRLTSSSASPRIPARRSSTG